MFNNPHVFSIHSKASLARLRAHYFDEIRLFFTSRNFLEVQTPLLVPNPGLEPYLEYFETSYVPSLEAGPTQKYYLPTSPEYHLKKALSWGLPQIFELTRSFRNGERSPEHEPEFWMLEWYRYPGSYRDIANDLKDFFATLATHFADPKEGSLWQNPQDMTVCDAFQKFANIPLEALLKEGAPEDLTLFCIHKNIGSVEASDSFETSFHKVMVSLIEPRLGHDGPLFLWDYPLSLCAMARAKQETPFLCERFEVYWKGLELANAFGELTDSKEQRQRCLEDQQLRVNRYGYSPPLDEEFFSALDKLTQPAAGIAVGVERVLQCFSKKAQIQEIMLFSQRKNSY